MNKKVLLVYPFLNLYVDEGAKHRLNSFIHSYHELGYDVDVLAFVKKGFFEKNKTRYLSKEANWILRPSILPLSRNVILTYIHYYYQRFIVALTTRIHSYSYVQMEVMPLWMSSLSSKKCRVATDFHGDGIAEYSETKGVEAKKWYKEWKRGQQKYANNHMDYCIYVSENLRKQLESNSGIKSPQYGIISCAVDYMRFQNVESPSDLAGKLGNRIVIGYCGGLQQWQRIDKVIELAIALHKLEPKVFLVIYTGHDIAPFNYLLDQLGGNNYFVKSLKSEQVPGYLKVLDAGLLLRENRVLNTVSSPTKICEYLAAGVPIICTQYSGDYARSVVHQQNGYVLQDVTASENELEGLIKWLAAVKNNRNALEIECKNAALKRQFSFEFGEYINSINL